MGLTIKPKKECRWDLISLGEVMVRFDPGDRRIVTARSFEVSEGGGEYNVARLEALLRPGHRCGHGVRG